MSVIWKFKIPLRPGAVAVEMPKGAEFLSLQWQKDYPHVWCAVEPHNDRELKYFQWVETGDTTPDAMTSKYRGTLQSDEPRGIAVIHLYEVRADEEKKIKITAAATPPAYAEPPDEHFGLCYVKEGIAYFTTLKPITSQWGNGWLKVPYEHNAGSPYEWDPKSMPQCEKYSIREIHFTANVMEPYQDCGNNSPFSVMSMNANKYPWLRGKNCAALYAGATIPEFLSFVKRHNGRATTKPVGVEL